MASHQDIQSAADSIDRFLSNQPSGADSAENILRWWMARHGSQASAEVVEPALNALERMGSVEKMSMEGGQFLYQRVKD